MRARSTLTLLALSLVPSIVAAQQTPAATLDFSGIMFGNWQMRTDSAAKAQTGGKKPNRFDLQRVYLNFRMPAGEKGSIRATTDIFQNTGGGGYYGGWTVRMKYAYFQYDVTKSLFGAEGLGMNAKVGMIQNVIIDHVDTFWPRWLSQDAVETYGFFSSADMGVGSTITLPKRRGEAYVTIMNGSGYTAAETDRFKDIAARFSWTPFANDSGLLRTLAISPWYSKGRGAGLFPNGGPGQVGPVTEGVQRDRRGVFVGVRDRRLTGGFDYAQRVEELEGGANTAANPRTVRDRTSDLIAVFAWVRPLELADKSKRSRLGLFARYDNFDFDDTPVDQSTKLTWFGATWDLNARITASADYQSMKSKTGTVTIPTNTFFFHWMVTY